MFIFDAMTWALLLLVLGLVLAGLELLFPTGGFLAAVGAVVGLASVMVAFFFLESHVANLFLGLVLVGVPVGGYCVVTYLPRTELGRAIFGEAPSEEEVLPENSRGQLVGLIGLTQSLMVPGGAIEIEGHLYDATSQGMPIEKGELVVVVAVEGNKVIVKQTSPPPARTASASHPKVDQSPQDRASSFDDLSLDDLG